jgi:hypothetical protein
MLSRYFDDRTAGQAVKAIIRKPDYRLGNELPAKRIAARRIKCFVSYPRASQAWLWHSRWPPA